MLKATILILCLLLGACAAPLAQLDDDAVSEAPLATRTAALRQQVQAFDGRRIRGVDSQAVVRMKTWLEKMADEDTDEEMVVLYERAIRGQLELMRTSEQRHGAAEEVAR